jgi:hypothetical protein
MVFTKADNGIVLNLDGIKLELQFRLLNNTIFRLYKNGFQIRKPFFYAVFYLSQLKIKFIICTHHDLKTLNRNSTIFDSHYL